MDYVIKAQTQVTEFYHTDLNPIRTALNSLEEFTTQNRFFLIDSGISYRDLRGWNNYTYADEGVKMENEGWAGVLEEDHFLGSYTRKDFKDNSGLRTLTAFDGHGPGATVHYNTEADTVTCGHCGAPTSVTLTSGGTTVYVCQHLSSTDFRSLVRAVAFSQIFTLFTNEYCLGWCSALLNSCSCEKGKIQKWNQVIFKKDKKNNVSTS